MTKQLSLDIPDKNYDELTSLSKFFSQSIEKTVSDILEVLGFKSKYLENQSREYKMAIITYRMVLSHFINAASNSVSFFNDPLEKLGAKGLYVLDDFDYDLDECELTFSYSALVGNDLCVDSIWMTVKPGISSLRAESIIDMEETDEQSIEKLKKVVEEFEEPAEFMDLETFDVNVEDEIEGTASLVIECQAESLEDFPTAKILSRVLKKTLKNAGITRKHNES